MHKRRWLSVTYFPIFVSYWISICLYLFLCFTCFLHIILVSWISYISIFLYIVKEKKRKIQVPTESCYHKLSIITQRFAFCILLYLVVSLITFLVLGTGSPEYFISFTYWSDWWPTQIDWIHCLNVYKTSIKIPWPYTTNYSITSSSSRRK